MRHLLIATLVAASSLACDNSTTALPAPTPLPPAAETVIPVCNAQIATLDIDVDYSGPYLMIDARFVSGTAPAEMQIERFVSENQTQLLTVLTDVVGQARVAAAFNAKYRVRARGGDACAWSAWVDRQIGPPNECGDCTVPPPPPPPVSCPVEGWTYDISATVGSDSVELTARLGAGTYDLYIYKLNPRGDPTYNGSSDPRNDWNDTPVAHERVTVKCSDTDTISGGRGGHDKWFLFVIDPVDGGVRKQAYVIGKAEGGREF